MITTDQIQELLQNGGTLTGIDGEKIGKIVQAYHDDETGHPDWITVKTGMLGGSESFVPLAAGILDGDTIRVPYDKELVKDAPQVDEDNGHLGKDTEASLYQHYGLADEMATPDAGQAPSPLPTSGPQTDPGGQGDRTEAPATKNRDTSGPMAYEAMTRSEEELTVDTNIVGSDRTTSRKYVVTENTTQTFPLNSEDVRVEREAGSQANPGKATDDQEPTSEEQEFTLYQEHTVVEQETATGGERIDEQIRKEQIEKGFADSRNAGKRNKFEGDQA